MEKVRYAMFVFIELKKIKIKKETDKKVKLASLFYLNHIKSLCVLARLRSYVSG